MCLNFVFAFSHIQTLRLFVKYWLRDSEDLLVITRKAAQINKFIVQFSFTDLKMADKFTQKCIEYLSISTVAVRHKEAEEARKIAQAKLDAERLARKKILDAQAGLGRKGY